MLGVVQHHFFHDSYSRSDRRTVWVGNDYPWSWTVATSSSLGVRGAWTDSGSGCQTWQPKFIVPGSIILCIGIRPPGVSLDFRSGSQYHLICCRWSLCNFISKRHYLLYATERYWCCICYFLDYANNRRAIGPVIAGMFMALFTSESIKSWRSNIFCTKCYGI